jgi:hypothetical protein
VVGGVELIARFVAGKLLDLGYVTVQTLFVVNMFIGGICSIIFLFFRHMGINIAYSVIFSVFPGVIQIVTPAKNLLRGAKTYLTTVTRSA